MATHRYVRVLADQTTQGSSYENIHNHNYYNIFNNYNGVHYDYRRMNNRYHHRSQLPRYHVNNYSDTSSNRNYIDLDLTVSSRYNNGLKPIYRYLESDAITSWFTANANDIFGLLPEFYMQAYLSAGTVLYDEWYRNDYELLLWEEYLKMGKENKFWTEEVLRYTKTYHFQTNMRFVQTQINQFEDKILALIDNLNDFKAELTTHAKNNGIIILTRRLLHTRVSLNIEETTTAAASPRKRSISSIAQLDICIKQYILQYTKYAKKLTETKLQLAQAQLEEFRLL